MTKCRVIETFATLSFSGAKGKIVEIPLPEAVKLQSCGLLEILPDEMQEPKPMAYETAKLARKANNTLKK